MLFLHLWQAAFVQVTQPRTLAFLSSTSWRKIMPWPFLLTLPVLPWPLFLPWPLLPWPLFLPWRFMSWPLPPSSPTRGFSKEDIISQLAKREQYKALLAELSTPIPVTHSSPSLPLLPSSVTDSWRWRSPPSWRWRPHNSQSVATILLIWIEYLK